MNTKTVNVIQRQKQYVQSLEAANFKYGLTVGSAFIRGIRDIGYKSSATALDELVDNSVESGASHVHIVLHDDGSGRKNNCSQIAVIDDGHGMIAEMIRASMLWGGTDRENSRTGIGRFGYGLPSSCVSQGRRFEVYSIVEGGSLNLCEVDLDDIEAGKYTTRDGEILVPNHRPGTLPRFVQDYIQKNFPGGKFEKGTVVLIDKVDRLTWKNINNLQNNLLEHFGVVYHKLRGDFELAVNGRRVEPIDPLFLTPGYRWYDLDADRAKALDPLVIQVKDRETKEVVGRIRVRYSYMSVRFGSVDKHKKATGKNANDRASILREYNGFIVARMGRIIDTVRSSPLTTFVNNDAYIKVELDFDASLDEHFNVPTSKQRVDVSDQIWDYLKENGVLKAIEQMRKVRNAEISRLKAESDKQAEGPRPSEKAMAETAKLAPVVSLPVQERREQQGRKRLQQEIEKRVSETGKTPEDAKREIEAELGNAIYKVAYRSIPGGSFFDLEQVGGTKVLFLNTSTKFFQEVHSGPTSTPEVRAALEVLLFSVGDRMIEGREELQAFYRHEIPEWSRKMEFALAQLAQGIGASTHDDADDGAEGDEPTVA